MADFPLRLWQQVKNLAALLRAPAAWVPAVAGFASLIVSLLIVPDAEPSVWNWFGVPLIAIFAALAILAIAQRALSRNDTAGLVLIASVALIAAVVLNLFLTFSGTVILLIGFGLIAAIVTRRLPPLALSIPLTGFIALLMPTWVWISLDAAHPGLLLLIPLGLIAWFADREMEAALTAEARQPAASARVWRFVSWLGVLVGATLTTLLAISSDVGNAWAVAGALGAIACIGTDVSVPQHASLPGRYSRPLIGLACAWLILCWLASL